MREKIFIITIAIVSILLFALQTWFWFLADCESIKEIWFLIKNVPGRCL